MAQAIDAGSYSASGDPYLDNSTTPWWNPFGSTTSMIGSAWHETFYGLTDQQKQDIQQMSPVWGQKVSVSQDIQTAVSSGVKSAETAAKNVVSGAIGGSKMSLLPLVGVAAAVILIVRK